MLAGIIFQLASLVVYSSIAAEFLIRFHLDKPFKRKNIINTGTFDQHGNRTFPTKIKYMVSALALATLCVMIRFVFIPFLVLLFLFVCAIYTDAKLCSFFFL